MKKSIVLIVLVITMLGSMSVYAANNFENNLDVRYVSATSNDTNVNSIMDSFESLLDPENNELERKVNNTLEKYKDNPIVKLFKKIAEFLTSFLDALFNLASEATEVEGV